MVLVSGLTFKMAKVAAIGEDEGLGSIERKQEARVEETGICLCNRLIIVFFFYNYVCECTVSCWREKVQAMFSSRFAKTLIDKLEKACRERLFRSLLKVCQNF